MMASVDRYSTKSGVRYRVTYRTPENRQTTRRGFRTKKEAQDFAAQLHVSTLRGEYIDASAAKVTLGVLGPEWLARQTHLKASSRRTVEVAWRVHVAPRWADVRLADLRHSAVQSWVADLSQTSGPVTVIRAFGVLAGILDEAVRDRRIITNPARGVKLPRQHKREHVYLTEAQVWQLAREAGPDRGIVVLLLAYTGLRWGELAGLHVADLDLLGRRVHVRRNAVNVGGTVVVGTPKTHERRSVAIPRFLVHLLAGACVGKGRDNIVFPGKSGSYAKPPGHNTWFAGAVARCMAADPTFPRVTPHGLRHTAASLAVSAGAHVKVVQAMLGHASAAMTLDTYSGLFDRDAQAVADAHDRRVSAPDVVKMLSGSVPQSVESTL